MQASWLDERTTVQMESGDTRYLRDLHVGNQIWTMRANGLQELTTVSAVEYLYGYPPSKAVAYHIKISDSCKLVCENETVLAGEDKDVWLLPCAIDDRTKIKTFASQLRFLRVKEVFQTGSARQWVRVTTSKGSFLANSIVVGG